MLHVALYQPEIPPNTGNIIRLCANSGAQLHIIKPMGFAFDDKRLRRAGLDYHEFADIHFYDNDNEFLATNEKRRIFSATTKTTTSYSSQSYQDEDMLLFGPETRGLPDTLRPNPIRIPMQENSRSLNLSNSVAIILFEALRQLDFMGGR